MQEGEIGETGNGRLYQKIAIPPLLSLTVNILLMVRRPPRPMCVAHMRWSKEYHQQYAHRQRRVSARVAINFP